MMLVLAGFVALATGTYRASRWLFGRLLPSRTRLALLGLGYVLLGASLARAVTGRDPARALVEWFGLLTLCALIVVGLLWAIGRPRD
jgi:hypothetical protein